MRNEPKLTNTSTIADDKINPAYSRPLDVHRYSNHSEVGSIVSLIWKEMYSDPENSIKRRGGAKPKSNSIEQLRVLILDLYVAWSTDPALCIGVHLSNTAWNTNSRYNALHLSRKIPGLVHSLDDYGYIQLAPGSYAGPGAATNRTARIRAAEPLRKLFREAKFGPQHVSSAPR